MSPTFSLVMTAFDTFHFLPRALSGVITQEHDAWELLVVIDGPAPESPFSPHRLLAPLKRRLPNRRIECRELPRAEGCWGNVARNFGLRQSAGDYVCWINHDNLISPQYLAAHAANVRKSPGCVSVVDIDYWRDSRWHGRYPRRLARSKIDLLNFAVPREAALAIDAFGGAATRVYAADWLVFDACRRGRPVEHNPVLVGAHF